MYEYHTEEFQYWHGQSKYLTDFLNVKASEGWELDKVFDPWAATNDPKLILVFRRRKKEHQIIAQEIAREELAK